MNELSPQVISGTIGELLAQLRLLQYGVQAAAPLRDSGNDLIAIRGGEFRALQVKTTASDPRSRHFRVRRKHHGVIVIHLRGDGVDIELDRSEVYLIPRDVAQQYYRNAASFPWERYRLNQRLVDAFWPPGQTHEAPEESRD